MIRPLRQLCPDPMGTLGAEEDQDQEEDLLFTNSDMEDEEDAEEETSLTQNDALPLDLDNALKGRSGSISMEVHTAMVEALASKSLTPILKEELRCKIQLKRLQHGQDEMTPDFTKKSSSGEGGGIYDELSIDRSRQTHLDPSTKRVKTEQTFESLFDKETHSDVVVSVNADEFVFHAHRMILEMKSDVLAGLLARMAEKPDIETMAVSGGRPPVPVLHLQEDPDCSQVFSRFLYFLYSGAVWLHQEYVLPLYRLAHKYGVKPLLAHCETYILQVLAKSCSAPASHSNSRSGYNHHHHNHNHNHNHNQNHHHTPTTNTTFTSSNANSPPYAGSGFPLEAVCDLYEDEVFVGDIQQTSFRVLCCQFRHLVRTERWSKCRVRTVCELISSDSCSVEENLILVSATDYMKRNNLSDKKQIEDILSKIRYPRLNRRVLYHLQKNGSFKNFPYVQELMLDAMKFHCFKDLPEAREDFVGVQYRPRISNTSSPQRRASLQVASTVDAYPEATIVNESAYSLEPAVPMTVVTHSRQSQRESERYM
nr:hypothetical protein BaRGS_024624 [Batillaria attramentaria]